MYLFRNNCCLSHFFDNEYQHVCNTRDLVNQKVGSIGIRQIREANTQSAPRVSTTASIGRSMRNSGGSEAALRVALASWYELQLGRGASEAQ